MDRDEILWAVDAALERAQGRTRRERIAMAIFAAEHSCTEDRVPDPTYAVTAADRLIAALDSTDDGAR